MCIHYIMIVNIYEVTSQWAKSPKKQSVGVCIFDNMALYFECRIQKRTPSDCFLAILPTGRVHSNNHTWWNRCTYSRFLILY